MTRLILVFAMVIAGWATDADRSKLAGSWSTQGNGGSRATWVLADSGDVIHITHMENDRKVSEFECNTAGRECDLKDSGKPAKISMWFNGPKLVVMETRGSDVVKQRFAVNDAGNEMQLEVIPIVPQGKTEVLHLSRADNVR